LNSRKALTKETSTEKHYRSLTLSRKSLPRKEKEIIPKREGGYFFVDLGKRGTASAQTGAEEESQMAYRERFRRKLYRCRSGPGGFSKRSPKGGYLDYHTPGKFLNSTLRGLTFLVRGASRALRQLPLRLKKVASSSDFRNNPLGAHRQSARITSCSRDKDGRAA